MITTHILILSLTSLLSMSDTWAAKVDLANNRGPKKIVRMLSWLKICKILLRFSRKKLN